MSIPVQADAPAQESNLPLTALADVAAAAEGITLADINGSLNAVLSAIGTMYNRIEAVEARLIAMREEDSTVLRNIETQVAWCTTNLFQAFESLMKMGGPVGMMRKAAGISAPTLPDMTGNPNGG